MIIKMFAAITETILILIVVIILIITIVASIEAIQMVAIQMRVAIKMLIWILWKHTMAVVIASGMVIVAWFYYTSRRWVH